MLHGRSALRGVQRRRRRREIEDSPPPRAPQLRPGPCQGPQSAFGSQRHAQRPAKRSSTPAMKAERDSGRATSSSASARTKSALSSSLAPARTSRPRRPYSGNSPSRRHPRSDGCAKRCATCSNAPLSSRQKVPRPGDADKTPVGRRPARLRRDGGSLSTSLLLGQTRPRPSGGHHHPREAGLDPFIDASAPSATPATPWTRGGAPARIGRMG